MMDKSDTSPAHNKSAEVWEDDIDYTGIFRSIWKTRGLVAAVSVLALIGLIGLLALTKLAIPTTHNYKQALRFTFSGVENHKYPNGRKFALSDLAAPLVLQKVYDQNNLKDFGVKMNKFISSISIYPYSPGYAAVLARYHNRLNSKKLNFAERKQIEKNMDVELQQHLGRSAIIDMTVTKRLGLSKNLAEKILNDIAEVWARTSIKKYGVLKVPNTIEIGDLVDPAVLRNSDMAIAVVRLIEANLQTLLQLEKLREIDGATTLIDDKSNQGIDSLQRKVLNFANYDLEELKKTSLYASDKPTLDRLRLLLERRKKIMEVQKQSYGEKASSLQRRLKEYNRDQSVRTTSNPSQGTAVQPAQDTAVSQVSEGFIRQIIALSEQKLEIEFKQKLVNQQLKFREREVDEGVKMAYIVELIAMIDGHQPGQPDRKGAEKLRDSFAQAIKVINTNWRTIGRFYKALGAKRLSYNGHLYSGLELTTQERYTAYHPLYNKKTWLFLFAGVLAAAVFAMFTGLLSQAMRRSRS